MFFSPSFRLSLAKVLFVCFALDVTTEPGISGIPERLRSASAPCCGRLGVAGRTPTCCVLLSRCARVTFCKSSSRHALHPFSLSICGPCSGFVYIRQSIATCTPRPQTKRLPGRRRPPMIPSRLCVSLRFCVCVFPAKLLYRVDESRRLIGETQ